MSEVLEAPAAATPVTAPVTSPVSTPAAASTGGSGVPEVWTKDWIQSDFTLNHKALDRLPDHLKGLRPTLERQKSFEDVLTVMQNQQVLAGKKALAPLPADAPAPVQAERKALLDTINGVPPSPKDYGITKPEDLPDSQWNPQLADSFTAWAHKHSVSPAAAKELLGIQIDGIKGQIGAQSQYESNFWAQEQQKFESTIKRENMPSDRASALVEKGAIALGLDLTNEATKTFLKGADARIMAMRHAVAIGEDSFVAGQSKPAAEANPKAAADDIIHNKANPLYEQYWNRDGKFPRSVAEAARAKVEELLRLDAAKNPSGRGGRR